MIGNNLELLDYGYGGMLGDGADPNIIDKLYDYILEKPLKSVDLLFCTGGNANKVSDCVVKLGKDICKETADVEICDMVEKAKKSRKSSKSRLLF